MRLTNISRGMRKIKWHKNQIVEENQLYQVNHNMKENKDMNGTRISDYIKEFAFYKI